MGIKDDKVAFIGHGIGMELDEPPALSGRTETQLKKDMTLALEPKIAFPKIGVVGAEDTFHLTETGLKSLTQCKHYIDVV